MYKKRDAKFDSKQYPLRDYYDNGSKWVTNKRRSTNGGQATQEEREFDTLKFLYGSMLAKIAQQNLSTEKIKLGLRDSNAQVCQLISSLQSVRESILQLRPMADQYLGLPFYVGIRVRAPTDPDQKSVIEFCDGSDEVESSVVRTVDQLSKFCMEVHLLLCKKDIARDVAKHDKLLELERTLDAMTQQQETTNQA